MSVVVSKKWIENTRIINYNSKREDLEEEDQRQDAVTKWKEMKTASKLIDGWIMKTQIENNNSLVNDCYDMNAGSKRELINEPAPVDYEEENWKRKERDESERE